jgi:hypothetical protein
MQRLRVCRVLQPLARELAVKPWWFVPRYGGRVKSVSRRRGSARGADEQTAPRGGKRRRRRARIGAWAGFWYRGIGVVSRRPSGAAKRQSQRPRADRLIWGETEASSRPDQRVAGVPVSGRRSSAGSEYRALVALGVAPVTSPSTRRAAGNCLQLSSHALTSSHSFRSSRARRSWSIVVRPSQRSVRMSSGPAIHTGYSFGRPVSTRVTTS